LPKTQPNDHPIDNVDDVNNANDADVNDADNKRKRRQSIKEKKRSRLDINLDRVEQLMMCYFFSSLRVNQAKFINEFALLRN
jgi:hypothetical protein